MSFVPASSPLTSIVLVSFYTGETLFSAIGAVLGQAAPVELIIVDNGNPGDVVARLQEMTEADARLKIITGHGNVGFSRGNNLGVAASEGEYLLILNPDCILREDAVEKLLAHARALRSPFMIGARILNEDGSDQRGCRRELLTPTSALVEALHLGGLFPRHRLNRHEEKVPEAIAPIPAISGAFMFLPRRDFDHIGGFDEGYFLHVEDLDLCFRFRKAGGEIYFAPDVVATHIGGTSEATSDFVERHKTRGFSRYFHRNFGENTSFILLACLDIAIWMRYLLRRCLGK